MKTCLPNISHDLQFAEYLLQVYCDKKDVLVVSLAYVKCNHKMYFCATNVYGVRSCSFFFFFLISGK